MIFIGSLCLLSTISLMGADYSFEVKNIEIWAPAFFKHNNSFIATVAELSLTEQVFGKTKDQYINDWIKSQMISSMPLLIFCKDKLDQEWLGDDIGMIANFCTDFYSTDQGICMTKNLNFYNFMELSKEFQQTFKVNVRFMSYSKCSNWRQISKLLSKFGCLFTFSYLDGANSIKSDCNLRTG